MIYRNLHLRQQAQHLLTFVLLDRFSALSEFVDIERQYVHQLVFEFCVQSLHNY